MYYYENVTETSRYSGALTKETWHPLHHSANVFGAYFAHLFRPDDHLPRLRLLTPTTAMQDFHITPIFVATKHILLDPHKSAGPDGLHPSLLRLLSPIIAAPPAHLFNYLLGTGVIPRDWVKAHVTFIFKAGKITLANNSWTISLTYIL